MQKDLSSENIQIVDLSLPDPGSVKDKLRKTGKSYYTQLQPGLTGVVKFRKLTTSFLEQPLDIPFNRLFKRAVDILFSVIIITLLLSWLTPLLALIIMIDSKGPVFFLQKRNKKHGEIFTCFKFRSMIVNTLADILPAVRNDKRITSVGRFLRTRFLDELPQFFNVLWGDMSVIGPRPHMISDNIKNESQVEHYGYRHKVKPGITGLAQVLDFTGIATDKDLLQARLNMDIFYIRHWSFKMDMIILYRTFLKIFAC